MNRIPEGQAFWQSALDWLSGNSGSTGLSVAAIDHQRRIVLCWLVAIPVVFANWCGMAAFAQTEIRTPEFGLRFLQDQPDHRFQSATLDRIHVDLSGSLWGDSLTLFRPECLPFAYQTGKVELVPKARPTDAKIRVFAASGPKEADLSDHSCRGCCEKERTV